MNPIIADEMPDEQKEAVLVHEWIHGVLEMNTVEHNEGVAAVLGNELYRQGFRVPIFGKEKIE